MSVHFCLALLALSSLTAASDPECEELTKPLEDRSKVSGKWIFLAGTSDNKDLLDQLKTLNSSWIEISSMPDSDNMTLRWGDKVDDTCNHGSVNFMYSENSTKVTFHHNSSSHEHDGRHLVSCPDCRVWSDTSAARGPNGETMKGRNLYFFTRTGAHNETHIEAFKKAAVCLNFTEDVHFGENTDLCPDDKDAKQEEQ